MDTYQSVREELAEAQQERNAAHWAERFQIFIDEVPKFAVTPMFMARAAEVLRHTARSLPREAGDCANRWLTDLRDDMEGYANDE